ncbi:G-type lectin S-receptor-like serine/threonine-protein kinase SD1-1 [Neltuma alba]|uniref:G-type lectin S-receptor-like serine/threonine-protein kinase SD1-1 n=1 Tax=Neltuma alba TaxID=207710 RepID=UPI0010A3DBBD|nr:G-type lectin S-receptor-like serine/threonine-protein kinase SD1-1 [Prosopis alba]
MTLEERKAKSWEKCSCTAYANSDIRGGGRGCAMWFGDLIDINQMSNVGQNLYPSLAANREGANENKRKRIVIAATILAALVMLFTFYCIYKRRKSGVKTHRTLSIELNDEDTARGDMELPFYNFDIKACATDNFSIDNKLGQGGFGPA